MKTVEIQVKGLCCADCAGNVEKALRTAVGVKDLKMLTAAEKVVVTFDEARTSADGLKRSIETLGYEIQGPTRRKRDIANTFRFTFITAIGVISLGEIGLEYLGLLEKGIAGSA